MFQKILPVFKKDICFYGETASEAGFSVVIKSKKKVSLCVGYR